MSLCLDCGKTLASRAGLRRHMNSQHERSEWHVCECGRSFLDPAGRSRCRARHSRSFGCSAWGCSYRSGRKDSVKQHIRRRHRNFLELPVLTLPPSSESPPSSSNSQLPDPNVYLGQPSFHDSSSASPELWPLF